MIFLFIYNFFSNKKIKTNDDNGNCTDEADDSNIQNEEKTLNKDIEMTEQNATRDVVMESIVDNLDYKHQVLIVKFNYNGKQNLNNLDNKEKKSIQEFSASIKSKYPQYKDMEDGELVSKMIEKYPQYKDKVDLKKKEEW